MLPPGTWPIMSGFICNVAAWMARISFNRHPSSGWKARKQCPPQTWAVFNYGLFNYPISQGPFIFRGHNGAVMGGLRKWLIFPTKAAVMS